MTRKDYIAIAEAVRYSLDPSEEGMLDGPLLVERLVRVFAEDNPRFDPSRFREACDVL